MDNLPWEHYHPYNPPVPGPLAEMSRSDARRCFDDIMAKRSERWEQLQFLVSSEGVHLGNSDSSVQSLNDLFVRSVEAAPDDQYRLANRWYAVVTDIAIVLGDVLIEQCPRLSWRFCTWGRGRGALSFQRHVIHGFTNVPYSKYFLDYAMMISGYGQDLIDGTSPRGDYFCYLLELGRESA